jgi:hypothetical protein
VIEKKLHYIWIGDAEPNEFNRWLRDDFVSRHPDWQHHYWHGADLLDHRAVDRWQPKLREHWRDIERTCETHRKWAYRADLLRLVVLYIHGGIYVDHDMFNVRPLGPLLDQDLILMQFRPNQVAEGLIGAPAGSEKIALAIDNYLGYGVRRLMGLALGPLSRHHGWKSYPPEFFCPHPRISPGDLYAHTENTYTIHCWKDHEYDRETLLSLREASTVLETIA